MAADEGGERTEQPTARRLQDARAEGQVARSTDLTASIGLLAAIVLLSWLGRRMFEGCLRLTYLLGAATPPTADGALPTLYQSGIELLAILGPFLGLLLVITLVGGVVQSGWIWTTKRLAPDVSKLNPVNGFKRIFSLDSVTRLGQGLAKLAIVGLVAYWTILGQLLPVLQTGALDPPELFAAASALIYTLALRLALVLLVLGIIDYFYQRWSLMRNLRMTKQEVRDELKRMEGDPLMRQRRRQIQQKLALQRIGIDVPKADVVVTNPTEFAVALRYDEATMSAPKLIAKGQDFLALRIRQLAQQHNIPVVQRPPLARALYAQVEVGHEVPARFYRAVAEVLAYVFQISGKARARAAS